MAQQTVKLGEIIGLEIPVDGKWTCLAKTQPRERCRQAVAKTCPAKAQKQELCRHPVAKDRRDAAREILQHEMTFQESEHDDIRAHIKKLVDLLFHKNIHPDIECQMSEQETKWLDLWRTALENRTRPPSQSYDSAVALEDHEQFPSEPATMTADHAAHEITEAPATITYPTLPIESPPVPTDGPVCTTVIASCLNRTITLDTKENISDQTGEVSTTSQLSVLGHDAPLALNQTSSHGNLGLSVFFSPNQLEMINMILHFGLQLCAFFQIQNATFISRDSTGNKRIESIFRFRLMFGVEFTLSGILTSPWVMFPLAATLGQLLYMMMGPWSSSTLFLAVAFIGSRWMGTKEKAIVRKAERV